MRIPLFPDTPQRHAAIVSSLLALQLEIESGSVSAAPPATNGLELDDAREHAALDELIAHYSSLGHFDPDDWARTSMSLSLPGERFEYVRSLVPASLFQEGSNCLISGMSAGSEMIVARRLGFGAVYGTEVDPFFVTFCAKRFGELPGLFPSLYDGEHLGYPDDFFSLVASSHIIEHTRNPRLYLEDHIRVLRPGGFLFLEFPTRYHRKELHTGLPSLEWLPRPLRNLGLVLWRATAPAETKRRIDAILDTHLKQISLWSIRRWVLSSNHRASILETRRFIPGVLRVLLQKL